MWGFVVMNSLVFDMCHSRCEIKIRNGKRAKCASTLRRRAQVKAAIEIERGRRVSVAWGSSLFLLIWGARVKGRGGSSRAFHTN
jgi:hypothetical protein